MLIVAFLTACYSGSADLKAKINTIGIRSTNEASVGVWVREPEFSADELDSFELDFPLELDGQTLHSVYVEIPRTSGSSNQAGIAQSAVESESMMYGGLPLDRISARIPVRFEKRNKAGGCSLELRREVSGDAIVLLDYSSAPRATRLVVSLGDYVVRQPYQNVLRTIKAHIKDDARLEDIKSMIKLRECAGAKDALEAMGRELQATEVKRSIDKLLQKVGSFGK